MIFKRILLKILEYLCIASFCFVLLLAYFEFFTLDGAIAIPFSGMPDSTIYSENYSDSKFKEIELGMTYAKVIDILGEPLSEWTLDSGNTAIRFSGTPNDGSYRVRVIHFNENHLVKETRAHLYVD